jgi:hypothetical protein
MTTKTLSQKLNATKVSLNSIYLRKRRRILIGDASQPATDENKRLVATLNKNLESLGFILSGQLTDRLVACSAEVIAQVYSEIVPVLREMVGAHRQFKPFYPNFPKQVMEASDFELYWNAMLHYWSAFLSDVNGGDSDMIYIPNYKKKDRPELNEPIALKVIHLGTLDDFQTIFKSLVGSNTSLSESDKEIVQWFINNMPVDSLQFPTAIPQKENLAVVVSEFLKVGPADALLPYLKTATDVLRVAVAMSGGDVSLAAVTKFRRFKRTERRFLLQALDGCGSATEDMLRWKGRWKRLGRELHPGDYQQFENANRAFSVLRNDEKFVTFTSEVESAFSAGMVPLDLLSQRPGVMARRLDQSLRSVGMEEMRRAIVDKFIKVADKVSTPVLLQVFAHFKARTTNYGEPRSFFPKGNVCKVKVIEDDRIPLPDSITRYVTTQVRNVLVSRFGGLSPLGRCYVDPDLARQIVPFAMRSASKSLRTLARGSRIPMPFGEVIRFFLWWKDSTSGRTDIDLSCAFYDSNWGLKDVISYYQLRNGNYPNCGHSGDITSAPNGACEFIDLSFDSLLSNSVRYVVMSLNAFTPHNFCDLPECFAGWMARQSAESGEVFEARTVQNKVDLAADSTICIPVILDMASREVIWTDLALKSNGRYVNNLAGNHKSMAKVGRALANMVKPTLYDLFEMHVEARGNLVDSPADAETVFSMNSGVTPYDYSVIASEYML